MGPRWNLGLRTAFGKGEKPPLATVSRTPGQGASNEEPGAHCSGNPGTVGHGGWGKGAAGESREPGADGGADDEED